MNKNRKVISTRLTPETIKKLDCLVDHMNINTNFWGQNKFTKDLGYCCKKVTRSDVLTILIEKAFNDIQNSMK